MKLQQLDLTNFKNFEHLELQFDTPIVCFVGNNGEGKTNLLDSIYYLCIGKSYFNHVEQQSMLHDSHFLRVEGIFTSAEQKDYQISILSAVGKRKEIKKNKVVYERVAEHLGFSPVCFVAPDDSKLILGGSEERRRFMTVTLSQINPNYVRLLTDYRKILNQRNALLKHQTVDKQLLRAYNQQIEPLGREIHQIRQDYFKDFAPLVQKIYSLISSGKEQISCSYSSQLNNHDFAQLLAESEQKDLISQRSTVGIHKDNISFKMNGESLKVYGSQGQQKTVLLSLKLAELQMISQALNKPPIFLLDDIFDKLDATRVEELFRYIIELEYGQLFITDTNAERLNSLLSKFEHNFAIFTVNNKEVKPYEE